MRIGIYARVSTSDQNSIPMQLAAIREYCHARHWQVVIEKTEIASGAKDDRPQRKELLKLARQRKIDAICVWRLDRWGRSTIDLLNSLRELQALGVAFISLTEALDLTTPTGRAMAGLLSVIAEFERELIQERVKAGVARYREEKQTWGRPATAQAKADIIKRLIAEGKSKSEVERLTGVARRSINRILAN